LALSAERLRREIQDLSNLPTLPGVVQVIVSMVEEENSNVQKIGDCIARDQVLSAKLLRMVNSPFYGFPGRISSVKHALVLLGFNVVKGLVLSTTVFDALAQNIRGLWEHSLGVAVLSRRIAKELNVREPDEIMVSGLLHDLGKVVMAYLAKSDYDAALDVAQLKHCHIVEAEKEIFGYHHAMVAGWVAEYWHLPQRLSDAITYHHHPDRAKQSPGTAAIVQLADILARGMGYGNAGDPTMPPIEHKEFRALGLSFERIDGILQGAEQEFFQGVNLFANSTAPL